MSNRSHSIGFWIIVSAVLAGLLVVGWVGVQAWVLMLVIGALPWVAPLGYWVCIVLSIVLTVVEVLFTGYKLEDIR